MLPAAEQCSPFMVRRGERGISERRYWEHTIRDDRDDAAHMDYVHFNSVRHGLVRTPADWPIFELPALCLRRAILPIDLAAVWDALRTGERALNRGGGIRCPRLRGGSGLFRPTLAATKEIHRPRVRRPREAGTQNLPLALSAEIRLFREPRLDQRLIRNVALVGGDLDALQERNRQAQRD